MQTARIALIQSEIPDDPPPGFLPLPTGPGFNVLLGPLYGRLVEGHLQLGMRIGRRHVNPHDTCHGGILAAFADMQIYVAQQDPALKNTLLPTVRLTIDYLSPARLGDWLEGDTTPLRVSGSLVFVQSVASVAGRPIFRSSAIHKRSAAPAPLGSTLGSMFDDLPPTP